MTNRSDDPILNQDDQLADFVDRVRNAGFNQTDSNADGELLGLEETILRLNRAFPRETVEEERIKRMQADFAIRKRRLEAQEQLTHRSWLSALLQSPVALAVATLVAIGMFMFLSSSLSSGSLDVSGAAGSQTRLVYFLPILGVIVFLILWLGRRK